MPKYEVDTYYSGYIRRVVEAEGHEEAIAKVRNELDAPCSSLAFRTRFEPILENLEPWKDADASTLLTSKEGPTEQYVAGLHSDLSNEEEEDVEL